MKQYIHIIGLLCFLFLGNACTDEKYAADEVVEGVPVDVKLLFTFPEMVQVKTKADMGETVENAVDDLQIFVFKHNGQGNGMLEKSYSFTAEEIGQVESVGNFGGVALKLPDLTSGRKQIVAIANLTSTDIEYTLGTIEKFSDLEKTLISLKGNLLQRPGGLFVMSGYYGEDVEESLKNRGDCTINPGKDSNDVTLTGMLWLRHLDSKIKFDVKVLGADKEFVPKDWKVVNVPSRSFLLPNQSDAAVESSDFFTQEQESRFEVMNLDAGRYQGGSFVFYMNENRKPAKEWPAGSTDYNLREYKTAQGGGPDVPFKYADPYATYVILRGSFYEYDHSGKLLVSADVRYTIHLGYLCCVASDFNSERNKSYTYNVTIENVDKIILEVESSEEGYNGGFKEEQPGAEGDVIMSDQNLLLDAHYEAKSITFYKDKLDNLSVMVRTPYESASSSEGFYKIDKDDGTVTDHLTDFKWIELAKTTTGKGYRSYTDACEKKELKNIKEVLVDLYANKNNTDKSFWDKDQEGNYLVTYTVFVNEYYYEEDPLHPNQEASWKEFVNAENRQMHILCDTKYSLDGQSSLTKSNIMINQRSIKSIYNVENSELQTAWGIETVEETGRYPSYLLEKGNIFTATKTNGRYNMFKFLGTDEEYSGKWDDFVDFSDNTFDPDDDYKYAEYVCLHRNRDLDGNGEIDNDEVRWYLPATNQYIGLWIGQDALPAEARLLQTTISKISKENRYDYHLISSNGTRFWTEEGVSTGNTIGGNNKFHVRCARNLGKTNKKPDTVNDEPQDYVNVTRNGSYVASVDLSRISPLALRSTPYTSIDFHTEHGGGDLNSPYKGGFMVDSETRTGTFEYDKSKGVGTLKGCPGGYRVPNQRELALIGGYSNDHFGIVDTNYKRLASCTYSALTYKTDIYLLGYLPNEKINYLTLSGNSTNYVRCVKDRK